MKIKFSNSVRRQQCRLCGSYGQHKKDIPNSVGNQQELSEKIFRRVGVSYNLMIGTNDRVTTKICDSCFDTLNESIPLSDSSGTNNSLTGFTVEGAKMTAGSYHNELDVANETHKTYSENRSFSGLSPTVLMNANCKFNGTKSYSVCCGPSIPDRSVPAHGMITGVYNQRIFGQYSAHYGEGSQLAYPTSTPSHIARKDFTTSQAPFSGSYEACGITNDGLQCQASKHSPFTNNSSVEDELNSAVPSANAQRELSIINKKREKKKAVKSVGRFVVKCGTDKCGERFESYAAKKHHVKNYHANGIQVTFVCCFCGKKYLKKRTLRKHMNFSHFPGRCFRCPLTTCTKSFTTFHHAQQHLNAVHTKEIEYSCTECSHVSYYKASLHKHLAKKHGKIAVYQCKLCEDKHGKEQLLQRHILKVHDRRIVFRCSMTDCSKVLNQTEIVRNFTKEKYCKKCFHKTWYRSMTGLQS